MTDYTANLDARHRGVYVRYLDLPRHRWEPSKATPWPLAYIPSHRRAA
jgi:hypothetical protein